MSENLPVARQVEQIIDTRKEAYLQAIGKIVDPDHFLRVAVTAAGDPELQNCTPTSIAKCILISAQCGLMPDKVTGQAYLVRYGNECQFIPGYKGLILAVHRATGARVRAHAVFKGDSFSYRLGLDPGLDHEPCGNGDPKELTHVYAVAKYPDGEFDFEVLTRADVERVQARPRGSGSRGPWSTDFGEMAKKTAIRRLCKRIVTSGNYSSPHMAATLEADNAAYELEKPIELSDSAFADDETIEGNKAIEAEDRKNAETHKILDGDPKSPSQRLVEEFEATCKKRGHTSEDIADILAGAKLHSYGFETDPEKLADLCKRAEAY